MTTTPRENHTAIPKGRDAVLLTIGILGIGTSGPLIALSLIPIPTLVMWRNFGGAMIMAPFALTKREWRNVGASPAIKLSLVAGVVLAFHFLAFFGAMRMTSVAAGTAITTMQPVFAALYLSLRGHHIPRRAWIGLLIAVLSVLLITGVDFSISLRSFLGDISAIVGAALSATYVIIGGKAQEKLSTSTYTFFCYGACALTALPISWVIYRNLIHFPIHQWLLVLALIVGAQIFGHTMFNFSLKRVSPAVVSLIVFFEVPVSALLAGWWLHQKPPAGTIPGIVGLLVGCAAFVWVDKS